MGLWSEKEVGQAFQRLKTPSGSQSSPGQEERDLYA